MKRRLLLLLLTVGCAPTPPPGDPRTISGVDPAINVYIQHYLAYKGAPLAYDIPAQFVSLPYPVVGECKAWLGTPYRQIMIDPVWWGNAGDPLKEEIVSHELGHCDLNRNHTSAKNSDGTFASFMNPYIFYYNPSRLSDYITELFANASSDPYNLAGGNAADEDFILIPKQ